MSPPAWALTSSKRLTIDDFAAEFAAAWAELDSRFLKLECWQTYQEQASHRSLEEFNAGNLRLAEELLCHEAEADRPLYEKVVAQGIDYARIRLVQLPPTNYLQYEMISYRIRAQMAENIQFVVLPHSVALPNDEYFDFLLFDRRKALVHDYGMAGLQVGGWLVDCSETIARLERKALDLRKEAEPLTRLLGRYDALKAS